jgi:hypothetical protein
MRPSDDDHLGLILGLYGAVVGSIALGLWVGAVAVVFFVVGWMARGAFLRRGPTGRPPI